jgi:hypothetical protein
MGLTMELFANGRIGGHETEKKEKKKKKKRQNRKGKDTAVYIFSLEIGASCWPGKIKIWSLHTYHKSHFEMCRSEKKKSDICRRFLQSDVGSVRHM